MGARHEGHLSLFRFWEVIQVSMQGLQKMWRQLSRGTGGRWSLNASVQMPQSWS
jgi:hypothetical protein